MVIPRKLALRRKCAVCKTGSIQPEELHFRCKPYFKEVAKDHQENI